MKTDMNTKSYPFPQENNYYTGEFEEMKKSLVDAEVDDSYLLAMFADILRGMDANPDMLCRKYIGSEPGCLSYAAQSKADGRTTPFANAVQTMKKLSVQEFLNQHHAYMLQAADDSGVENGYLYESFLEAVPATATVAILNPPPYFVWKIKEDDRYRGKTVSLLFSDPHEEAVHQSEKSLEHLFHPVEGDSVYALVFSDKKEPEDLFFLLAYLHERTTLAKNLTIRFYGPSQQVDGNKHRKNTHSILCDRYTISKIDIIEAPAFQSYKKNHNVLVLEKRTGQDYHIPVCRIRLQKDGEKKILVSDPAVVIYSKRFCDGQKTVVALLNDAQEGFIRERGSLNGAQGEKESIRFEFSREMIGYGSASPEMVKGKEKFRLSLNMYGKPNTRQVLSNLDGRGSTLFKQAIRSSRKNSYSEAVNSAMELLGREVVRQAVCADLRLRENDDDFSLFSFWFLHKTDIEGRDQREINFARRFFLNFDSEWRAFHNLPVHTCTEDDIRAILESRGDPETDSSYRNRRILRFLKRIFAIDVKAGRRDYNPCDALLDEIEEEFNTYYELRKALGLRSQTNEQNRRFLKLVLGKKYTSEYGMAIGALICFLSGTEVSEVCDSSWDCLVELEKTKVYTLAVNWKLKELALNENNHEKARHCIPLCELLCKEILEWKEFQAKLPGYLETGEDRIVTREEAGKHVPVSKKALNNFLRKMINEVGIEPMVVPISRSGKEMQKYNASRYSGPWLRMNFDYHLRLTAKMPIEDLNYILGRKLRTTDARHYQDYQKDTRQLAMKTAIERWVNQMLADDNQNLGSEAKSITTKEEITFDGTAVPTQRYVLIRTPKGKPADRIKLTATARFGLISKIKKESGGENK